MRKKYLAIIAATIIAGGAVIVYANSNDYANDNSVYLKWGSILYNQCKNSETLTEELITDNTSDFTDGNSSEFSSKEGESVDFAAELDRAIAFYKLKGVDNPEQQAAAYVTQQYALYLTALENGFSVSDDEVWDYLSVLKKSLENSSDSESYNAIMSAFPSEDDYWNFEFTVYQKELPVKKYLTEIAHQYATEIGMDINSNEFQEMWLSKLETIKLESVEKYFSGFTDSFVY